MYPKSDQRILKRVQELLVEREQIHSQATARAVEALSVTVESLLAECEEVRRAALEAGQYAITAIKEKGR